MTYNLIFDIGIKNYAYCLAQDKNIIIWNVLDVSNEVLICKCKDLKKTCNKKALFYDEKLNGYCAIHKKLQPNHKLFKRVSSNNKYVNNFTNISDNVIEHLHELYKKICMPYDVVKQDNELKVLKCYKINVYIENQLALSNPTAKSLSILTYTFFKLQSKNIIQNVNLISASVKTKISFLSKFIDKDLIPNLDKTKDKKKIIVLIINDLVKKMHLNALNTINILHYDSTKKKDDMADCLAYHLFLSNIIF
jgi:hypothetical protein